jgi:hypothetical protein
MNIDNDFEIIKKHGKVHIKKYVAVVVKWLSRQVLMVCLLQNWKLCLLVIRILQR